MALANQAKLSPVKHEEIVDGGADDDDDDDDDDASMSTDEYNSSRNDSTASSSKTPTKSARRKSGTKLTKKQKADAIQYGPIVVKPRKSTAPTLANGRRSKDEPVSCPVRTTGETCVGSFQLPPEEDCKRRQRRDRNKQAAAKCRRKRNDLREELETVRHTPMPGLPFECCISLVLDRTDSTRGAENTRTLRAFPERAEESIGGPTTSIYIWKKNSASHLNQQRDYSGQI